MIKNRRLPKIPFAKNGGLLYYSRDMPTFGDMVKAARTLRGLSQEEAAKRCNGDITDAYISLIETGAQSPDGISAGKLKALQGLLGLPPSAVVSLVAKLDEATLKFLDDLHTASPDERFEMITALRRKRMGTDD
jgi:transcriptional regulator with XRE-family HTH domain